MDTSRANPSYHVASSGGLTRFARIAHGAGERHAKPQSHVHLGVAVSLRGGGLLAPAIHDADQLELGVLMLRLADLVERTRQGKIRSSELTGGTITVTSLGERGVEFVLPIIVPPQVAIVGFGKIVERPWVRDGKSSPARS